ncbi:MAG: hypothetical protein HY359_16425 [Candidatus Rokubacteria bacterium]|nr:hypothetical protein [Candidatus Rokubacteria bacterium]
MGGLPANRTVNGFAASPADPKVLYAALRDGLFKSPDGGATWTSVGKGLKNMAAVTVNPKQPTEVYAASAEGVIFRSRDGGTTWERQK